MILVVPALPVGVTLTVTRPVPVLVTATVAMFSSELL